MNLGVDIGGTFTDLVAYDPVSDRAVVSKVLNQGRGPDLDLLNAISGAGIEPGSVQQLTHGTTVVTNLLIERSGAPVGLITTHGFRDVLEIQLSYRPKSLEYTYRKTPALVPRHLRVEIGGRIDARGNEVEPIDAREVERAVRRLLDQSIGALAIVLYNSYANPTHERALATIAQRIAPHLPTSLSVDVDRRIGEYQRTSTTVLNAMAVPRMQRYVDDLGRAVPSPINYMHSAAGVLPPAEARLRPIQLAFSGPAAGVLAGREVVRQLGFRNAITMDMGGTSCDVALIWDDEFGYRSEIDIEWGIPARIQALDVRTIGAGGGSICWVDSGGALRVGPRSAGAVPGPACYGRGGTDATVTDANLVLGILSRQGLLGGALPLDFDAACTAVERVGKKIGVDAVSAAKGIHSIVSANMAQAIRQITVHRGIDPRDCALVAFGGAGPQHATAVAEELGIKHVVVPTNCSVLSAVGLLTADPRITASRTLLTPLDNAAGEDVEQVFEELTAEASSRIGQAADGDLVTERWFGLRYVGQSHDVPIRHGRQPTDLTQRFEAEHQRLFGTQLGDPIEIVDAHVTLTKLRPYPKEIWRRAESGRVEPPGRRRLGLVGEEVDVFQRASLPSHPVAGPCLIEEHDAVTVVPSSVTAAVRTGHLLLEME